MACLLTLNVYYAKLRCVIIESNEKTALVRIVKGDSLYRKGTVVRVQLKDVEEL